MAESQDIEKQVMADIKAVLDAASISNVIAEHNDRPEEATWVEVRCLNLRGNLQMGTIPSGMRQADIAIEAHSYYLDDTDGADLHALVKSIRDAIYRDDVISTLNSTSTNCTYYGLDDGDDLPDEADGYRIISIQFSLVLKSEKT